MVATPTNDTASAASGLTFYGGRASPLPLWLRGKVVNAWGSIANTTPLGFVSAYCGVAWREQGSIIQVLDIVSGGHSDNPTSNPTYGIRLDDDVPAWTELQAASSYSGWSVTTPATSRFPIGNRPAPRHSYWYHHWVPEIQRFMLFGAQYVGSNAYTFYSRDAFNPAINDWDVYTTWSDVPNGGFMTVRNPLTGMFYATQGSLYSWNPNTDAFVNTAFTGSGSSPNRGSDAFDTARGNIYHLSSGDNWSAGSSTIHSVTISTAGVRTDIIFNSSVAWTDFQSNASSFLTSQLDYNADDDCFYFYNGGTGQTAKVYRIKPNGTAVWDMTLLSVTGVTPPVSLGSGAGGVMNKFRYISRWKTLILVAPNANIHFMRVG